MNRKRLEETCVGSKGIFNWRRSQGVIYLESDEANKDDKDRRWLVLDEGAALAGAIAGALAITLVGVGTLAVVVAVVVLAVAIVAVIPAVVVGHFEYYSWSNRHPI